MSNSLKEKNKELQKENDNLKEQIKILNLTINSVNNKQDEEKENFFNFIIKNKTIKNIVYIDFIHFYDNDREIYSGFKNYSYLMIDIIENNDLFLFKTLSEVKQYLLKSYADSYYDFNPNSLKNNIIINSFLLFSIKGNIPREIKYKSTINIDIKE